MNLEFEKKFVLKPSFRPNNNGVLIYPEIATIWQCYSNSAKGKRHRAKIINGDLSFITEKKTSIKLGTDYSLSCEEDAELTQAQFNAVWKSSDRWCGKIRYTYSGFNKIQDVPDSHVVVIDYHLRCKKNEVLEPLDHRLDDTFLVMSEVETMLTAETRFLDLEFRLPLVLRPFCIKEISKKDKTSKIFSSYNLTPTEKNIETILGTLDE